MRRGGLMCRRRDAADGAGGLSGLGRRGFFSAVVGGGMRGLGSVSGVSMGA